MKIEVDVSDVKQLGKQLRRSGNELEHILSQLNREMGQLSLRSQGRAEVDQSYSLIKRSLQEIEQSLGIYGVALDKKADDFKEADGKAPPRDWSKVWAAIKMATSVALDFLPVIGNVKGFIEALVGRDLITGAELSWYERVLSALGPMGKGASKGAKLLKFTDEAVNGVSKFVKTTNSVVHTVDKGKSVVEGLIGRDLVTGEKLSDAQRAMAFLQGGKLLSEGKKRNTLGFASESADANRRFKHADDVSEAFTEGSHKKGNIADAGDAIGDRKLHAEEAVLGGTAGATTAAAMSQGNRKKGDINTSNQSNKGKEINTAETPSGDRNNSSNMVGDNEKKSQKTDVDKVKEKDITADPIHTGTGHQFMTHPALKLYGAATWSWELSYNSGLLQKSELGLAWSHNYAMRLEFSSRNDSNITDTDMDTNTDAGTDIGTDAGAGADVSANQHEQIKEITLFWNAGRRNTFQLHRDGNYYSKDTDVLQDRLCPISNGYVLIEADRRERYFFNKNGVLERHVNREGLALNVKHNEHNQLICLQDELSKRQLHFTYDSKGLLSVVRDDHRSVNFTYDSAGWLAKYQDAENYVTLFNCDEQGRILTIHNEDYLELRNVYDPDNHRVVEQYDAKGNVTKLSYDFDSRPGYLITTITNRVGDVLQNVYDENYLLLEVIGSEGILDRYTYNEQGQELTHENALGEINTNTYDERGNLIATQDALGNQTSYRYDDKDLLIAQEDALGGITAYNYDEQDRLIGVKRSDGASCHWEYDQQGKLIAYQDYAGHINKYEYNDDGVITAIEDAEGRRTFALIDEVGRITCVKDAVGGFTERTYNANDQLMQVQDALGRCWQHTYDKYGQLVAITNPLGARTVYTYTPAGQISTVTHPLGGVTTYHYDAEDRLIADIDPNGGKTSLHYNELGYVTKVVDPLERAISYHYDATGRLEAVKDHEGQVVQKLTYNANGQPIAITNALGHTTQKRFNALYQQVEQIEADGVKTTYHYDAAARLQEVVQGLLPQTLLGVDKKDTSAEQGKVHGNAVPLGEEQQDINEDKIHTKDLDLDTAVKAEDARVVQHYDAEHRVTMYRDANGNETYLNYDRTGKILEETNSSGFSHKYTYDERGWLTSKQNARGQQQDYSYDLAGQLTHVEDEVGQVELEYDEAGRWVVGKEGEQEIRRSYDLAGRLIEQFDVWSNRIGYQYDKLGNLTKLTYPDGKIVEYRYNLAGELTEVKDWAGRLTRYRYDTKGRLIETKRPNGTREQRSYDLLGQLLRQQDANAQGIMLQDLKYEYNEVGQIVREQNKQYTYDQLRRFVSGANQGTITYYRYDLGGNLTKQEQQKQRVQQVGQLQFTTEKDHSFSYSADNRLKSIGIYPTELDADGNLLYITDGEKMAAYTYDSRNRLIQSGRMKYRYNWRNERIETVWKGKVTRYVVDDSSELSKVLMEQDGEGKVIAYYVYGLGLIGREDGATGQYQSYHSDIRGSTTFLTDEQGKISDRYSYGYYGEVLSHEGSTHQPFQYNGRDGVMHDANGLYYMRARYYHPELKRFLNRDVLKGYILEGQTLNRYAYVNGDPVSYVDPLGLEKQMVKSNSVGAGKVDDFAKVPFLPDEAYGKNLPKFVEPGTKSLNKYGEFGNLKQTKYYDDYGREKGWIDYSNHGYPENHSVPHWHEVQWNEKYPTGGFKIDHRMDTNPPFK
ncbi:RHS repeat-associated protein [Paenibacillus turicensis]|uniref:RHS repeat-associated protein n=1 Tax=Paenibacillus turicensis TaxID=160487 RepID=A0ABS4FLF4_9BACL|nr:pre-toxin TG domain-containing protein [Paenibacillus turicensis]MBP1903416.1 RHS repeat-associated protein [Paenibacillus turicensis]